MGNRVIRVYPENRSLYFDAFVWDTKCEMYKANSSIHPKTYGAICAAHTQIKFYKSGKRITGSLGEIHFNKKQLGSETVAHEFIHAGLAWARRIRIKFDSIAVNDEDTNASREEERLCQVVGNMTRQFIDRCYRLGVYG